MKKDSTRRIQILLPCQNMMATSPDKIFGLIYCQTSLYVPTAQKLSDTLFHNFIVHLNFSDFNIFHRR